MIENLLLGLPGARPGGLILTLLCFVLAGFGAIVVSLIYAAFGALLPRASLAAQALSAVLRGIPLLLLVFALAHAPGLGKASAGILALLLYSFSHVGEILRGFLVAYPREFIEQSRVLGLGPLSDWLTLRFPWLLRRALPALLSHWVSLLKDTGALVILGIGELTTVAKGLSEASADFERWALVLGTAALIYLAATLMLIEGIGWLNRQWLRSEAEGRFAVARG